MTKRRVLFRNGYVHTPGDLGATAVLVEGDTIAWIGHEGAALAHRDGVDRVVDLDGALLTPAFVDAHVHVTATGIRLTGIDLSSVTSAAEALTLVREQASDLAPGEVLLGHGYEESRWTDPTLPTLAQLDDASPGNPVYLTRIDLHSSLVNGRFLDLGDLRSLRGFHPDAHLSEEAHHGARAALYDGMAQEQRNTLHGQALATWARHGLGGVQEMAGPNISSLSDAEASLTFAQDYPGPQVALYWGELGGARTAQELGAVGAGGDLFADGSIGSRTAATTEPYADSATSGTAYLDASQVSRHVLDCIEVGVQAGFHAIGDAAIATVVEGFTIAGDQVGAAALRRGSHRIEDLEMPTGPDMDTIADLGITTSMQPTFDALWGGRESLYADRFMGWARAQPMNPLGALAERGIPMAFGSDSPVTEIDPWAAVRAAIEHRTDGSGIAARAAFNAHTRGGWRSIGHDSAGILRPGAPAPLAVWDCVELGVQEADERISRWSTDPRAGTPMLPRLDADAPTPECLMTIRDGEFIHDLVDSS